MDFGREIISSRQNRRVVELCKLTDRKAREAGRLFRFDGIKLLAEAVLKGIELDTIFLRASDAERLERELCRRCGAGDRKSVV